MAQAPVVAGQGTVLVGTRFNEDLVESVDELAAKRKTNRSALIREAVQLLVEQEVTAS